MRYTFEDYDGVFHRMRMLNEAAARTTESYFSAYDADIILPPVSIEAATNTLRSDKTPFVNRKCVSWGPETRR